MIKKIQAITFISLFSIIVFTTKAYSQEKAVVDEIIAVVGNSIILKSDVYNQMMQYEAQPDAELGSDPFCEAFEETLHQKLLYNQAMADTLEIPEGQVEATLERRLQYFTQQIGSREELEAYYGKTTEEIKADFRDIVREQELTQKMESEITKNVRVTPSEVKSYYNNLSEDEIPIVESQIELSQIVKIPPVQEEEVEDVKRRLNEFRERIREGDDFSTLAIMYSDDPGSARNGGDLGFVSRGELFRDFEAVVFNLEPGEVSDVFSTQAGYHIAKLEERRGEMARVRHILLRPSISSEDMRSTQNTLDSIRNQVINTELSFGEAAQKFSDHPSGTNKGIMVSPHTGTTRFQLNQMNPQLHQVVERLEEGEISRPVEMMTEDGEQAFRLVQLRRKTEPTKANLDEHYDHIKQMALEEKKNEEIAQWIENRIQKIYIHIDEKYRNCSFSHNWLKDYVTSE